MKFCLFSLSLMMAVASSLVAANSSGLNVLVNPGFEEDADNVGYPDGWKLGKDAKVSLVRDGVAQGSRALLMEDGYCTVDQELSIPELAGKKVLVSLLARSPDTASLGVRLGCYQLDENGKKVWMDFPLIWDRALPPNFESLTAVRKLPENAIGGRFWIGLYRSKKEGTIVVDDVRAEIVDEQSALSQKEATIIYREINYLQQKLDALEARKIDHADVLSFRGRLDEIRLQSRSQAFPEIMKGIATLKGEITGAVSAGRHFLAVWSEPFERLAPELLPALSQETDKYRTVRLQGEYGAFGIELVNAKSGPQSFQIQLEGENLDPFAFDLRRQVLMETWYTKGATVLADPLTQLKGSGRAWSIELEPGEIAKLFIQWKAPSDAQGIYPGHFTVRALTDPEQKSVSLPFELEVMPLPKPSFPRLAHYQFLYMNLHVANDLPEVVAADLEAHGVTDIEWAFMPPAKFSEKGELLEVDWRQHDRWLKGFASSDIRLNIFWEGSYGKLKTGSGGVLPPDSPEERRAIVELLKAYVARGESLGVKADRFTILLRDEIHSNHLQASPDVGISAYCEMAEVIGKAGLRNYLTIGNYTFPNDVRKVLPDIDVAMPHWPLPESLKRNAPPEYNPRQAFFQQTLPMLEEARQNRDLQIWSYHVFPGKSGDVLRDSRAYPILAVAAGFTGIGAWAYNVSSGSTWDDTDGRILDYSLIYDGREEQPINRHYNVTGETIVPSIQWEALRAGQQDGQILLALQDMLRRGNCDAPTEQSIRDVLAQIRELGGADGYGSKQLSFPEISNVAERLRQVYAEASRSQRNEIQ